MAAHSSTEVRNIFLQSSTTRCTKEIAETSKEKLEQSGVFDKPIAVKSLSLQTFTLQKNIISNTVKKILSGITVIGALQAEIIISKVFGGMLDWRNIRNQKEELKKKLTDLQYEVTTEMRNRKAF